MADVKASAIANRNGKRLDDQRYALIVQVCDEILAGQHQDMRQQKRNWHRRHDRHQQDGKVG